MNTEVRLSHISSLAQTARSTWLGLLGLLIFVGITIMAHKDSDFFAHGASTTLPIIGVEVPTDAFFLAAPLLVTAFYCYMNIFLFGLWDALGKIDQIPPDPETDEMPPLAELIVPTIFTIAALWYRNHVRQDGSMSARIFGIWTVIIAVLLGWAFCWVILAFVWWRSMPAHEPLITIVAAVCLCGTLDVGLYAISAARTQLGNKAPSQTAMRPIRILSSIAVCAALILTSYGRTKGFDTLLAAYPIASERLTKLIPLSRANLREAHLSVRPRDWLVWEDWRKEIRSEFARREGIDVHHAAWTPEQKINFDKEARRLWQSLTHSLDHQNLENRDLRGADLSFAFMAGIDLEKADLTGANLKGADASGAVFKSAQMQNVNLSGASLQGANLSRAGLEGVRFVGAQMQWADLTYETEEEDENHAAVSEDGVPIRQFLQLPEADFSSTELEGVNFGGANLRDANFIGAGLEGTSLAGSDLQGADFSFAQLLETDLRHSELQNAHFWKSRLIGVDLSSAIMTSTRLDVHTIEMNFLVSTDLSNLSSTNMDQEDFDKTFGDATTVLPPGIETPCHWPDYAISGRYHYHWRDDWMAGKIPPVARGPDGTCPDKL
ncbi:pentapeptide repeat-containing protein [Sulfitobacter sp. MF3-043]|uniref:pentapeptide repeat-containing protein n=1 Tax=Sulfitobacter sediminivivens TaxID=3252902 RepID=UPI0036DB154F